jgi:hypothetical protein
VYNQCTCGDPVGNAPLRQINKYKGRNPSDYVEKVRTESDFPRAYTRCRVNVLGCIVPRAAKPVIRPDINSVEMDNLVRAVTRKRKML